jgi:hypothetical protein
MSYRHATARGALLFAFTSLAACTGEDAPFAVAGSADSAATRSVHGVAKLYAEDAAEAGCVDDGTQVTTDGAPFGVRQKWPSLTQLSDGNTTGWWIFLPDASTCNGQPNPPNGHFVIGTRALATPPGPPMIDRDTDRLRIRGLAISGDASCAAGALDLNNIGQAGDDIAIVASGVWVGWQDLSSADLASAMSCKVTMRLQAQAGFYIESFHGALTAGLQAGADPSLNNQGSAHAQATASGSVGAVSIPPLASMGSSSVADPNGVNLALDVPYTADTAFLPPSTEQCGTNNPLVAVELDIGVAVQRDNAQMTASATFDGYDFAFLTLPCN